MFREMRRLKQKLSKEECKTILQNNTSGVLAVTGDDGYPYAVPLSYVYVNDRVYFHSARSGHKIDAINNSDKASFCVVDQDLIVPEEYTTYFRSIIAFGTLRILTEEAEIKAALDILAQKYSPDQKEQSERIIQKEMPHLTVIELNMEHISGKEAVELRKQGGK